MFYMNNIRSVPSFVNYIFLKIYEIMSFLKKQAAFAINSGKRLKQQHFDDYARFEVALRGGFTLLNFTALSGVVSGQSSSNVMGRVLALAISFNSSSEKASSSFIVLDILFIFTIILHLNILLFRLFGLSGIVIFNLPDASRGFK